MTCDNASFLLERRWDRSLTPEEEGELDRHLSGCADCRMEAEAIHMADVAFLDLGDLEPPVNIAAAVARRIAQEAPVESRRGWVWAAFGILALAWGLIAHFGVTVPMGWTHAPLVAAMGTTASAAAHSLGVWLEPVAITIRALSPALIPLLVLAGVLELGVMALWTVKRMRTVGAAG